MFLIKAFGLATAAILLIGGIRALRTASSRQARWTGWAFIVGAAAAVIAWWLTRRETMGFATMVLAKVWFWQVGVAAIGCTAAILTLSLATRATKDSTQIRTASLTPRGFASLARLGDVMRASTGLAMCGAAAVIAGVISQPLADLTPSGMSMSVSMTEADGATSVIISGPIDDGGGTAVGYPNLDIRQITHNALPGIATLIMIAIATLLVWSRFSRCRMQLEDEPFRRYGVRITLSLAAAGAWITAGCICVLTQYGLSHGNDLGMSALWLTALALTWAGYLMAAYGLLIAIRAVWIPVPTSMPQPERIAVSV